MTTMTQRSVLLAFIILAVSPLSRAAAIPMLENLRDTPDAAQPNRSGHRPDLSTRKPYDGPEIAQWRDDLNVRLEMIGT